MDPPKRERKRVVNYAENEYFRQAMKSGTGPRASGVRLPKMPQLQVAFQPSPNSFVSSICRLCVLHCESMCHRSANSKGS